ncbi:TBC1 domain family member 20 isoform X2 [Latimeria chalumnae]|uniref:TBC1 domain family member 20 isoform X2 n=1 Tax=Latimeria chalumnae TaxID=7897 RepID=UPI0003C18DB3|nr:PREDICTED: TBC1 domain family member 20-like isoform X2 [Latimeria chalumnae]|eukprot:XP_006011092.1 PREDICTED: TBC1 domain family member 20-like isoform X2 [Latimeria chalumnae]
MSGRKGRRFSTSSQNGSYLQSPSPAAGIKPAEMESRKKRKLVEIHQALISDPVDIQALQRAAVSEGGLLTDEIRRKVWPKLLSVNVYCLPPKPVKEVRRNHKDFQQVLLDVHRSFRRFPKGMRCEQREVLQEQLTDVILDVLRRNPQLHYYQGYHDIAVTFLLVVGKRMTVALLEKLSTHHLRSEVGTIFALSWLITWYGHVLSDFRHVLRLYDFFLTSHPLMAVYFAAVIVLHREEEVLHCDCDVASVHHLLSQIPQDLPYEELITHADDLFRRYPPVELAKQAALQQRKSIAISSFRDLQLATLHQRPDSVLRRQLQERPLHDPSEVKNSVTTATNQLVKMAVWGLSATLGAAALAVAQTAMEWAPEFLFQLF